MNRIHRSVFVLAVGIAGCQDRAAPNRADVLNNPALTMHRLQAGFAEADGWYTARSTEGRFIVRVPYPFNDFTINMTEREGAKVFAVGCVTPGGVKFSAVRSLKKTPGETTDSIFAGLVAISEKNGATTTKRHEYFGHAALDVHTKSKKNFFVRSVVLSDESIMMIVDPQGNDDSTPADVEKFFNSLRIDD
jgi:hypothetical protein